MIKGELQDFEICLECFDIHELVLQKPGVLIWTTVDRFDENWSALKSVQQELLHSSHFLLMRVGRAVVVFAAAADNKGFSTVVDPMLFRNWIFSHDRGDKKVKRAKGEVMIWETHFDFHCHQNWPLDSGCCPSKGNRALVILTDVEASFWSKKLDNCVSCLWCFCCKHPIWMLTPQVILKTHKFHWKCLDMFSTLAWGLRPGQEPQGEGAPTYRVAKCVHCTSEILKGFHSANQIFSPLLSTGSANCGNLQ